MHSSSAPRLPTGFTAHGVQFCFLEKTRLCISPPFPLHHCCPPVLSSHWDISQGLNTQETLHISSILYRVSRSPRISCPLENKFLKNDVWVVQVCKEKFILKSAVLKYVPFRNSSGWLNADPSLFSFLCFWHCVTFLAIGSSLFVVRKSLDIAEVRSWPFTLTTDCQIYIW